MLFFPVKLHIQFQNHIYRKNPLFPICVRLHLYALVHNGSRNVGNHVSRAACAVQLCVKWQHILCPLKGIFLILAGIEDENCQLTPGFYHVVFQSQVKPAHLNGVPQKHIDIRLV